MEFEVVDLNPDDRVSLSEFIGEEPEFVDEKFVVDTTDKAEWCMAKAAHATGLISEFEVERDRLIARINEVCDQKTAEARKTLETMAYLLDSWARQQSVRIRKKTVPLVNGEIKIQTGRESVVVDDQDIVEAFARDTGHELINTKITKTVDKNKAKKLLKEIEVIPGLHVERGPDKLVLLPKVDSNALPDRSR